MWRPFTFIGIAIFQLYFVSNANGKTSFSNKKDEETCQSLKFKKVSLYRRVSTEEMTRKSAHECCKMRGMNLYSTERVDEPTQFTKEFKSKLGGDAESKWFWISANNLKNKLKYKWEFGGLLTSKDQRSSKWDPHEWDTDEPKKENGRCAAAKVQGDKMIMKIADCEKDIMPFICELEPQKGGYDIEVDEIAICQTAKIEEIKGFPSLKIFEHPARWKVANLCCQMNGWSLLDNVVRKGPQFHAAVTDHDFGAPESGKPSRIWTSGNDLCEYRKWKWACGESAGNALDWFKDDTKSIQNPDNMFGMENCMSYVDDVVDVDIPYSADDVSCDSVNTIICESNPRCSVPEQYPCGSKEPRTYDIQDTIDEDAAACASVKFEEFSGLKPGKFEEYPNIFLVGDKTMSWTGAMSCCKEKNLTSLTVLEIDDKSAINFLMEKIDIKLKEKRSLWTSSKSKAIPLLWPDGRPVEAFSFSKIQLHSPVTPICGKVMSVSSDGAYIVTANCTERNYVTCMKRNESYPLTTSHSSELAGTGDISHFDTAQTQLYAKSLTQATSKDKEYSVVVIRRDKCPNKFQQMYHEHCPKSSSHISTNIKPKKSKLLTEEEIFKIDLQNKRLLTTLITDGVYGYQVPSHAPKLGFKILGTTLGLYSKMCPIVPADFLQSAFRLFHDLHWSTSQGRTDVLKQSEYKWISKLLRNCAKYVKPIHARTEHCGEEFISVTNCSHFVCTSPLFEFKLYRTDPLVDILWKVYEMAHSVCFPSFEESYRMFHKYAQSIMDLWSSEIKLRWFSQLANNDFWMKLLGPAYEVHLVNMERCNQALIMRGFFHIRLPRNTIPDRARIIGGKEYKYKTD